MKNLLQIFNYIYKFYGESFTALKVFLQFLLVRLRQPKELESFLQSKDKAMPKRFYQILESFGIESLEVSSAMNWKKVLRMFLKQDISLIEIEDFIQTITLQKTILKLYSYVTPLEINRLVCGLLNIQKGERLYNPCCGMGSWILSLKELVEGECEIFGEDINPQLIEIAQMLALIANIKADLVVSNVFEHSHFTPKNQTFDKIFCHPPTFIHSVLPSFRNDLRFLDFDFSSKISSEILFFLHSLKFLHKKAAFIIRTSLLYKSTDENLRKYLFSKSYLELIIDLPHNIFPRQNEEFSLLILSCNNSKIYFFDAQSYFTKKGKYNKMVNLEEILDCCLFRQKHKNARLLDYQSISWENLRASFYVQENRNENYVILKDLLQACYRGQRIEISKDGQIIDCYELGVKEFFSYGITQKAGEYVPKSNLTKLEKLRLYPFDILLSMRGQLPKIAIMGEIAKEKRILVNAGILVLRPKNRQIAEALYVYFNSKEGSMVLNQIYKTNQERVGEREIEKMPIPKDIIARFHHHFTTLQKLGEEISQRKKAILQILGYESF